MADALLFTWSGERYGQFAIDLEQVRRDQAVVGGLALLRQVFPAGHRAATDVRAAKTATGKVLDLVIAHRVVKGDLLATGDRLASDEVAGAGLVEFDAA